MMGPDFQQPRKKINQKAQGKKKLAGGWVPYVTPRHLVVNDQDGPLDAFGNHSHKFLQSVCLVVIGWDRLCLVVERALCVRICVASPRSASNGCRFGH